MTVLYLLLSWILIVQFLDVIRSMAHACSGSTMFGQQAFLVRIGLSTLSIIAVVVGMVFVFNGMNHEAFIICGISKLFLTISGYIFVLWPPLDLTTSLNKIIKNVRDTRKTVVGETTKFLSGKKSTSVTPT